MDTARNICISMQSDPWASEYSTVHDTLVVGSSYYISFYPIQEGGAPRQVLCYDMHRPVSEFKLQQSRKSLISTVFDSQVLIWDPIYFTQPIVSVKNSWFIQNFQWCAESEDIFLASSISNAVQAWDMRTMTRPCCELFVGKTISKLSICPNNANQLAAKLEDKMLIVWDMRMFPSSQSSFIASNQTSYDLWDLEFDIIDFNWYYSNNRCGSRICVVTSDGYVRDFTADTTRDSRGQSPSSACISLDKQIDLDKDFKLIDPRYTEPSNLLAMTNYDYSSKRSKIYSLHNIHDSKISLTETAAIKHRIFSAFYRNGKILAFTGDGILYDFPVDKKNVHNIDNQQASTTGNEAHNRRRKHSFSSLKPFLVNFDSQTDYKNYESRRPLNKPLNSDRNGVVGPTTFLHIISEELQALEFGINNRLLEGVRLGCIDQFLRHVVLEFLIPKRERFAITMKNFSTTYGNYYDSTELDNFNSDTMTSHRIVALTIVFPAKIATFWSLKYYVENRSTINLGDSNVFLCIAEELLSLTKNKVQARNNAQHSSGNVQKTGSLRSYHTITTAATAAVVDVDYSIIFHIAKLFRKRIFKLWEAFVEQSQGQVGLSYDSVKQSIALSLASEPGKDAANPEARYLPFVESRAFTVPLPRLSGGVFNGFGQLILFGNALVDLSQENIVLKSHCSFLDKVPTWIIQNHHSGDAQALESLQAQHTSYAYLMCTKFIKQSNSEVNVSSNSIHSRGKPILQTEAGNDTESKDAQRTNSSYIERQEECLLDPINSDSEQESQYSSDTEEREIHIKDTEYVEKGAGEVFYDADIMIRNADAGRGNSAARVLIPSIILPHSNMKRHINMENSSAHSSSYYIGEDAASSKKDTSQDNLTEGYKSSTVAENLSLSKIEKLTDSANFVVITPSFLTNTIKLSTLISLGPSQSNETKVEDMLCRIKSCRLNALVIEQVFPSNRAYAQLWSLVAVSLKVYSLLDDGGFISWEKSSMGKSLLLRLLEYLADVNDIQMWAAFICVIGGSEKLVSLAHPEISKDSIVGIKMVKMFDMRLSAYRDILQRLNLSSLAGDVSRYISCSKPEEQRLMCFDFRHSYDSGNSKSEVSDNVSNSIGDILFCSICEAAVRSVFLVCELCGHGGHAEHLTKWFALYEECASGCGCRCSSSINLGENEVDFVNVDNDQEDNSFGKGRLGLYGTDLSSFRSFHTKSQAQTSTSHLQDISMEQNYKSKYNLYRQNVDYDDDSSNYMDYMSGSDN